MSPTWEAPDMHMKQGADMDRVQRVIGRLEAGTRVRPSLLVAGTRMSRM